MHLDWNYCGLWQCPDTSTLNELACVVLFVGAASIFPFHSLCARFIFSASVFPLHSLLWFFLCNSFSLERWQAPRHGEIQEPRWGPGERERGRGKPSPSPSPHHRFLLRFRLTEPGMRIGMWFLSWFCCFYGSWWENWNGFGSILDFEK